MELTTNLDKQTLIGTRAIRNRGNMTDDKVSDFVALRPHSIIASQHSYAEPDKAELITLVNELRTEGHDVALAWGETKGAQSSADLCNLIVTHAFNSNGELPFFGIFSLDLLPHIARILPELVDRLAADPSLSVVGPIIPGVHNEQLLAKIKSQGVQELTPENIGGLFVDNSFAVYRLRPADELGTVPSNLLYFPRESDNGAMGKVKVTYPPTAEHPEGFIKEEESGGNEIWFRAALALALNRPLNVALIEFDGIARDEKKQMASAEVAAKEIAFDAKRARRIEVYQKAYRDFGVTREACANWIKSRFQLILNS